MANRSLKKVIETSSNNGHDLLTWITTNLEKLICLKEVNDNEIQEVKEIHTQLDEFVRYISVLENTDDLELHSVFISLSQLYTISIWRLKDEYPGVVFDSAAFLTNVLCEEDVSIDDGDTDPNQKKKKKKSSTKKKSTYTHRQKISHAPYLFNYLKILEVASLP